MTRGLAAGDGLFESVATLHGRPFALTRHLDRLAASGASLGLPVPDALQVRAEVERALRGVVVPRGRLRIAVTHDGTHDEPTPVLTVVHDPTGPAGVPAQVVTSPWRRDARLPWAAHKVTSYADFVLALAAARRAGADEAVLANDAGDLCEGTGSSVFYVVDGELRTPSLASGCLPGVTRALVLEWCGAREVDEPLEVARAADEVFLASTTRDVAPVVRWDDRVIPGPGPVTVRCMATWAARVPETMDP